MKEFYLLLIVILIFSPNLLSQIRLAISTFIPIPSIQFEFTTDLKNMENSMIQIFEIKGDATSLNTSQFRKSNVSCNL